MTDYKQAGDLVPDDLYIRRWCYGPRDQIYRVITTRPGSAATIAEVIVEATKTGRRSTSNFFRTNRVEIVPREPQKERMRPNYGEAALRRDARSTTSRRCGSRRGGHSRRPSRLCHPVPNRHGGSATPARSSCDRSCANRA
jgi:hypothetical protein